MDAQADLSIICFQSSLVTFYGVAYQAYSMQVRVKIR